MLALNIIQRSYSELLTPLDYNQGAPLGFLVVEKLASNLLGNSEYSLRLFPFACGILSTCLFATVGKHVVDTKCLIIATALFAFSYKLVLYSAELKQYSSDISFALIAYATTFHLLNNRINAGRAMTFGVIGAAIIWFSHPVIFILGGVGIGLLIMYCHARDWGACGLILVACCFWCVSFAILYVIALADLGANTALLNYWSAGFMPFPPKSLADLQWFDDAFSQIFADTLGMFPASLASAMCFIGLISLYGEDRTKWLLLTLPLLITLLAAGLRKYPFSGRLLLFTAPIIFLLIAKGMAKATMLAVNRDGMGALIMTMFLLAPQIIYSSSFVFRPHTFEDVKPVIGYIREHWRDGDVLYLYQGVKPTFEYYAPRYEFKRDHYVVGEADGRKLAHFTEELNRLKQHGRLWVLFSHVEVFGEQDDEKLFVQKVNERRTLTQAFRSKKAAVYLYGREHQVELQ